jgi:hypothetical protein
MMRTTCSFLVVVLAVGSLSLSFKTKPLHLSVRTDSELTLFMRSLFDHTQKLRDKVRKGKKFNIDFEYVRVNTAKPTFPEKIMHPDYKRFTMEFLEAADRLNRANPNERIARYREMIETCISCHKVICPGPIMRIKQLEL